MISAPCPVSVPAEALTRLLFHHGESDVAGFHGRPDTFHKSFKAEVSSCGRRSRTQRVTDIKSLIQSKERQYLRVLEVGLC